MFDPTFDFECFANDFSSEELVFVRREIRISQWMHNCSAWNNPVCPTDDDHTANGVSVQDRNDEGETNGARGIRFEGADRPVSSGAGEQTGF